MVIEHFENSFPQDYLDLTLVNKFNPDPVKVWSPQKPYVAKEIDDYLEIETQNGRTSFTIRCPDNEKYDTDTLTIASVAEMDRLISILDNHKQLLALQVQQLKDFDEAYESKTFEEYYKKYPKNKTNESTTKDNHPRCAGEHSVHSEGILQQGRQDS